MDARTAYQKSLWALRAAKVPFVICGAYAFQAYTGLVRRTKDLDIALRRGDLPRALGAFRRAGFRTEVTFPHWLAKARMNGFFVDILFSSGNGLCVVDDDWFLYALPARLFGVPVSICPPEEMIWSKAFVMERERFDGADVAHLLRACGDKLDWDRLFRRFARHERLLLAHLLLFEFVYPAERGAVPARAMNRLWRLARREPPASRTACRGPLLSRAQYLVDVTKWGYADPRRAPRGRMSGRQIARWTRAISGPPRRVALKGLIGVPKAGPGRDSLDVTLGRGRPRRNFPGSRCPGRAT